MLAIVHRFGGFHILRIGLIMSTKCNKLFFAWVATIIFSVAIVKLTSIGEVILVISEKRGMGIHSFDLIVFIPIILCIIFTAKQVRNR